MCPIVRTQFFVLSFFDIIIISFCRISVYILRHFFCFDILDKNADKTKKYKDLYILHDNSRQNLTVHLPSFSSDFHMQLSKIITANIAVKWGQGSNLPVIRPDSFVTPTDYLFADFYNTQRTLCQCSIKSCYIIVIHVDIYSLCRSRRVKCTDHRTGRVKYFLDKHISPYKGCCRI